MGLIMILLIPFVIGIIVGLIERNNYSLANIIQIVLAVPLLGLFIYLWITDGFWSGMLLILLLGIPFGVGMHITGLPDTVVHRGSRRYSLECKNCGCTKLEILCEDENHVTYKCRNCGTPVITELRK